MASILVVEDNSEVRLELAEILLEEGYQVKTAADGIQAVSELENHPPDLVLLDLMLPGIDGLSVLKKIKKQNKNIIVIIVSGASDLDLAVETMKMGAFDFIKKPYVAQELLLVIRNALRISYERRELDHLKKRMYERSDKEIENG